MCKLFNIFSSVIAFISFSTLFAEDTDKKDTFQHWNVPNTKEHDASTETEEERLAREENPVNDGAGNSNKPGGNELTEEEAVKFTENVTQLIGLGYTEEEVKQLAQEDIDKILNDGKPKDKADADKDGWEKDDTKPETIYQFSDKVQIPESKVKELASKTRDEFGAEDFDALPETVRFKLIQKDINIYEGSRNLSQKNQEAATARKDIIAERAKIEEDKAKLDEEIKKLEAQKIKDTETLEQNIEDVIDVDDKITLALEQKEAKERLLDSDTKITDLKAKTTKLQTSSAEIVVNNYISELMQEFPELQTTNDENGKPRNPIEIYDNPGKYIKTDDYIRSVRLSDIITRYLQKGKDTGLSITEWYETEKNVNYPDLKLKNPAQPGKKADVKTMVDVKKVNTAQLLKDIFAKAQTGPPNPRGQSSDGNSTVNLMQKDDSTQKKQAIATHWQIPSGTTGS